MSNVSLSIGGYKFTVACAEGEEEHIADLGRMIDEKLAQVPKAAEQGEARMLLFSSLLLADELYELKRQPRQDGDPAAAPDDNGMGQVAQELEALASKFENLATMLES